MAEIDGTGATEALITALESKKPLFWQSIFSWAAGHPPRYPWRRPGNPYDVLIGELLLEKARTAPVVASERFRHVFPSIDDLLTADETKINRALARLHLRRYRRSIIGLAKGLATGTSGELPCDTETLARVSGLERYHVRAIFCFGYGLPLAVVDGHVRRMLQRIFAASLPQHPSVGLIETLAESLVPYQDPQTYNGVLLDLAEMVCRIEMPLCQACPLLAICDAAASLRSADGPPAPSSHRSLANAAGR
jgi:A/G-specific adenine glycosylase